MERPSARKPTFSEPGLLEGLQARVTQLEHLIEQQVLDQSQQSSHGKSQRSAFWYGSLVIKNGRIRHQAQDQPASILSLFPHVKTFVANKARDQRVQEALSSIRQHFPKPKVSNEADSDSGPPSQPHLRLSQYVPTQEICHRALETYFGTIHPMLYIFDEPSLRRRCQNFWKNQIRQQDSLIPSLVLICVIVSNFITIKVVPTTLEVVHLTKFTIAQLGLERLAEIEWLQVQILYIICLQLGGTRPEHVYKASGDLVRSALIAGLHLSRETMPLHRRLWMTILEMDLQAASVCGLPTSLTANEIDTKQLIIENLNSPFQRSLHETLVFRFEGSRLLHEGACDDQVILTKLNSVIDTQASLPAGMSSFELAILTVVWHRSAMSFARPLWKSARFTVARKALATSSVRVLERASRLEGWAWVVLARTCGQDIFQASLFVCLMIQSLRNEKTGNLRGPPSQERGLWNVDVFVNSVQCILELFFTRSTNDIIGVNLKNIIALSVVLGAVSVPHNAAQSAMDHSFNDTISRLSAFADTRTPAVHEQTPASARNGRGRSLSSDVLPGTGANNNPSTALDLDFGSTFEEAFPIDPKIFHFDPSRS